MNQNDILSLNKAIEEERAARLLAEKKYAKLEESLLQKESEFKGIYENINDAFVLIDLEGNVLKMNEIAEDMFQHKFKDGPLNLMSLVHPEDYSYTIDAFKNLLKNRLKDSS